MITTWVTLSLNVPVFKRTDDVSLVSRSQLYFNFISNIGILVFQKEIKPSPCNLTSFFIPCLHRRTQTKQCRVFEKHLLNPGL